MAIDPRGRIGPKMSSNMSVNPLGHIGPKIEGSMISAAPPGHMWPKTLDLGTPAQVTNKSPLVRLINGNTEKLTWQAQIQYISGANWLQLSQYTGLLNGKTPVEIAVNVDAGMLAVGSYEALVDFDWVPPEGNGDKVQVILNVP
jgi:Viral BACON domain